MRNRLAVMAIAMITTAPARASSAFLSDMRKAESFAEDEDKVEYFTRAIEAWTPAEGNALLAECHFRRGEALFRLAEPHKAEPDFDKALSIDPNNGQAKLLRGRVRLAGGRAYAALEDLSDYASNNPADENAQLWLGEAYLAAGKPPQARHAFEVAGKLAPADFRPSLGIGRSHLLARDWDRATRALKVADQKAGRQSPDVLAALGDAEIGRGRARRALEYYDAAIAMHEGKLIEVARAGAPPAGMAEYRGKLAQAYWTRAGLSDQLAHPDAALADYKRACELGHEPSCRKAQISKRRPAEKDERKKRAISPAPAEPGDTMDSN